MHGFHHIEQPQVDPDYNKALKCIMYQIKLLFTKHARKQYCIQRHCKRSESEGKYDISRTKIPGMKNCIPTYNQAKNFLA